jgi:hypothetical protein
MTNETATKNATIAAELIQALQTTAKMIRGRDIAYAVIDAARPDVALIDIIDGALAKAAEYA